MSCSSSQLRNHDAQKERHGESPMRRGYVPLSARTPCPVRLCCPSIDLRRPGRVLYVSRSPVSIRLLYRTATMWMLPIAGLSPCGSMPAAMRHRHRLDHTGSKELRSMIYTWVSVWEFGRPALPRRRPSKPRQYARPTSGDRLICRVGKGRKRSTLEWARSRIDSNTYAPRPRQRSPD